MKREDEEKKEELVTTMDATTVKWEESEKEWRNKNK